MLKNLKPRLYQEKIFGTASRYNTLVILPTGLGKTAIALMMIAHRLMIHPDSKALFLAPTKPLCEQHHSSMIDNLDIDKEHINIFTGKVSPAKRKELWKISQVIVSTPQGLENDIINENIDLSEVSLIVFDEAHHAVGDYAYTFIAKKYYEKGRYPRVVGLTASPGADLDKIKEVTDNLGIEKVEVRSPSDPDVAPYVKDIDSNWIGVELDDELKKIIIFLNKSYEGKLSALKSLGLIDKVRGVSKKDLLSLQRSIQKDISSGVRDFSMLKGLSLLAEAMKVQHALEMIESQGVEQAYKYTSGIFSGAASSKVKAVKNLISDPYFKSANLLLDKAVREGRRHPKMIKLEDIMKMNGKKKVIIFTQYRDSASRIDSMIKGLNMSSKIFVGQSNKDGIGMSQKKQREVIDEFKDGKFDMLVCTSVAEEGLDIPSVDSVIFYEPIPSAIRHIQRRGRTGRLEKGSISVLYSKGTRDEAYRWSSFHKEKNMYRVLDRIKKKFDMPQIKEKDLKSYAAKKEMEDKSILIVADYREKNSTIIKDLIDIGVKVRLKNLEHGDYLASPRVLIERKSAVDFVSSIIDGRLFEQLRGMNQYQRPVFIIEGEEDIYSVRKVHGNAIRGAIATIAVSYGIPVISTKNQRESAQLIAVIAKREQDKGGDYQLHQRKPVSIREQQEYIVSSFPGIGLASAKELLRRFGSIKELVNSDAEEMKSVEGIGDIISSRLRKIFDEKYKE